ncbi:proteoglycan 4 isoform X2 [Episyrphus balteatus]|uniref:proteoglycan 4 isoform X2 n=1 Tax=Episyrphus balteatus TaxID=286459 RepID=UPI002486514A|nr:proteoglycan 4 isoform X2 [Episyrphus balteatus]
MIGSFWNLCRACPSMPVDKQLHSEYRSTYRWHEFTGNSRPEVVRRAPVPNQFDSCLPIGPSNEPPLPRRKKCPELAYKSHEFIIGSELTSDSRNNVITNRARPEGRGTPSRRSKSEGPPGAVNDRAYPIASETDGTGVGNTTVQPGESSGLFKNTISKLSTEYRLQFVWPKVRKSIKGQANDAVEIPKKSQSMGAIKSTLTTTMPTVHKKRTTNQKEATLHELEPLVTDVEERKPIESQNTIVGKKSIRPFSQTQDRDVHFTTKKENFGFEQQKKEPFFTDEIDNKNVIANGHAGPPLITDEWYKDVVELRKKAGEYKCRGWGTEIDPTLFKKQKELWDQVSKRSSLSALSLASSIHRPITKEEKEQENNKKFTPFKSVNKPRVPGQAHLIDNKDESSLPARYSAIRHHLERTTGPDIEEGALLPSPTREKLMPAIPKSRESESQRGSPKKSAASRHGSPQKGSPQKGSPKKTIKSRSQSVGPGVIENESPKRRVRSSSTAPASKTTGKKTPVSTPITHVEAERKLRPSTLNTSTPSRTKKSISLHPNGKVHSVPVNHHIQKPHTDSNKASQHKQHNSNKCSKQTKAKPTIAVTDSNSYGLSQGELGPGDVYSLKKSQDIKLLEHDGELAEKEAPIAISSFSPQPAPEIPDEPIVKSPPEPTRVKSPEQIIMRSPDPVNWTVPLDTGKTFTVTQNVKEGENYSRPQSEIKASTPVEKPPPAPQSAPPELTEQVRMDTWKGADFSDPKSSDSPTGGKGGSIRFDKPVSGSTLRCLDDPTFESDTTPGLSVRNNATDVLEKARDRFDRFWGGSKEDNV